MTTVIVTATVTATAGTTATVTATAGTTVVATVGGMTATVAVTTATAGMTVAVDVTREDVRAQLSGVRRSRRGTRRGLVAMAVAAAVAAAVVVVVVVAERHRRSAARRLLLGTRCGDPLDPFLCSSHFLPPLPRLAHARTDPLHSPHRIQAREQPPPDQ